MKYWMVLVFFIGMSSFSSVSYAQEEPVNKHYEKKKEKRAKEAKKAEAEILKQHEDIQTKNTKKMMKESKKKSKRLKKGKSNEPFYKKWFIKK